MQRRVISFAPTGLTALYYGKIETDLKAEIIKNKNNVVGKSGNTAVLNRMIAEYFFMKYGKEARSEMRNIHYKEVIEDIEGQSKVVKEKYNEEFRTD